MKSLHLGSMGAAFMLLTALLASGLVYARVVENRSVRALASQPLLINIRGSALQRSAFQQPDLLPIYGSSELLSQAETWGAGQTFATYPTGFAPYQVAEVGESTAMVG